jgi:hypothetical protein
MLGELRDERVERVHGLKIVNLAGCIDGLPFNWVADDGYCKAKSRSIFSRTRVEKRFIFYDEYRIAVKNLFCN